MAVDLSKYDLTEPDQFLEAAEVVAKSVHDNFGDKFSVKQDGDVYVNVDVLVALVKANTQNAIIYALGGREGEKAGIELVKQGITMTAIVNEARASV